MESDLDSTAPREALDAGRARIDRLDADIRRLIGDRVRTSAEVQRLKNELGAPRIDPDREHDVVEAYRRDWGEPGAELAHRLLELSRGSTA